MYLSANDLTGECGRVILFYDRTVPETQQNRTVQNRTVPEIDFGYKR